MKIILASSSKRRQDLLKNIGLKVRVVKPYVREEVKEKERVQEFLRRICKEKAEVIYQKEYEDSLIISSDTVILFKNTIIGKPKNKKDAIEILSKLSSNCHQVLTGVFLRYQNRDICDIAKTKVFFDPLSEQEILYYLNNENYRDKAGAYAIQGIASLFIKKIEGCYFNVMGFPLNLFFRMVKKLDIPFLDILN